jgi:hypothetical protein
MDQRLQAAAAAAEAEGAPPDSVPEDWEQLDELADEWDEDGDAPAPSERARLTQGQLEDLKREMAELREFHALAKSILKNSKGEVLLTALRRGFAAAAEAQAAQGSPALQQKAVIFTESRRTQEYLFRLLERTEFAGRVMLFNGTNTDLPSKAIYQRWLTRYGDTDRVSGSPSADMRAALVDHFRDEAAILIATEAAAEGINLQFCNLVVNYDLPWNPQRVEQRIGRCHRYGQKFDVVVVNFLNKTNAADQRVYELLAEKFRLFNGVFGASDEVLGAVESGVDFEKRIAAIYQRCRTVEQIQFEFDQLQRELETQIVEGQRDAREKLLDNFDQEVVEKVRIQSQDVLDQFNGRLWRLTRYLLRDHARFEDPDFGFLLHSNPFAGEAIHPGPYRMGKRAEDANTYRVGHPLAQRVLALGRSLNTPQAEVAFRYRDSGKRITILDPLVGKCGWLACVHLTVRAMETEDHLFFTGATDASEPLDDAQCRRLFDLPGGVERSCAVPEAVAAALSEAHSDRERRLLEELASRNGHWFDLEMDKLDRWAEDRRASLKATLDELDELLKAAKKAARLAPTLPEKLERQREARLLESKRDEAWRAFDVACSEIDRQKDRVLDEIGQRLEQEVAQDTLFTIRWRLI